MFQTGVPFNERGGKLRGVLDAVSGRFPRFVFGGAIGRDLLPVFHFHDEIRADLEPKLQYLAENGYRSVTSDEIAAFIAGRGTAAERAVALCFDDAWTSVWTTAAPLLRQYGFRAIVYAIPGRVEEATARRPAPADAAKCDEGPPFVTWPELEELHRSGAVDVQSHTYSHSRIFSSEQLVDFAGPEYGATPLLNRPQIAPPPALRFVTPADLGAPIYRARSRMSDGRRVVFEPDIHERCTSLVRSEGGTRFFDRPDWRARLESIARTARPRVESDEEQRAAIELELDRARSILNDRLRTNTVNHICLPWGVSGVVTEAALGRLGYRTAFANRLRGVHAVRRGDDRFWLKRLPNKYIFRLPGRGRRTWG